MCQKIVLSKFWKLAFLLCFGALITGCAAGNQYDYKNQSIAFSTETQQKVGVAVVDERSYVVLGEKTANFVGLQRAGFGNPFDVTTKSNGPLADSFAYAIVEGLKKRNVNASVLKSSSAQEAVKALNSIDASRLLLIHLTEWKTDTYASMKLLYDVKASVSDPKFKELAENKLVGTKNLGSSDNFHVGFSEVIGNLINDPKIIQALK